MRLIDDSLLQSQRKGLCPSDDTVWSLALGLLEEKPGTAVEPGFARHIARCSSCRDKWTDAAGDLEAAGRPVRPAVFRLGNGGLGVRGFPVRIDRPLRDGGSAVVHSTLVPWGKDYMIVEVLGLEHQTELRLEKGEKNTPPLRISLYKDDRVVERFHLTKKHSWRLCGMQPGRYRLRLEELEVLAFQIVP